MVSLQTRIAIGLMRALGMRRWLGRSFDQRGRADPHGGGISQVAHRRRRGVAIMPVMAGASPAAWLAPVGARSDAVVYYLHGGGYT
ncbi:MAG: hypothetical protein ACRDID_05610, partial [Ktedonobacterales bacterium]